MMKLAFGTESRKVAMFVPVFAVGCVFCWFGKVSAADWVDLVKWSFTALAVGLTAERFAPGKQA